MKIISSKYSGRDKQINVKPIGDVHIGHVNCNYKLLDSHLKELNETTRCILMGDILECATKDSIGKGVFETNLTPKQQINRAIEILEPYKDYIDGAVIGNHETRISNITSLDVMDIICKELNIPYLGYQGIVKYAWNEVCYTINMWHGSGGGASIQSAFKTLEDMANKMYADIYCCGHVHKLGTSSRTFKIPDTRNNIIRKIKQHFVLTGSCLESDDGYAEMKGLHERILGYPLITLNGNKRARYIKVSMEG
jgi:predicted phosphodiesterase